MLLVSPLLSPAHPGSTAESHWKHLIALAPKTISVGILKLLQDGFYLKRRGNRTLSSAADCQAFYLRKIFDCLLQFSAVRCFDNPSAYSPWKWWYLTQLNFDGFHIVYICLNRDETLCYNDYFQFSCIQ